MAPVEQVTRGVDPCTSAITTTISQPESSAVLDAGTVVVVAVVCREREAVVRTKRVVVDIAREPGHCQLIAVGLIGHGERAVLGPEPRRRARLLHVKSQLASTVSRHLMDPLVAQPEVSAPTAKPNSEFIPRSIEEVRVVNVLLNQYGFLSAEVCNQINDKVATLVGVMKLSQSLYTLMTISRCQRKHQTGNI